MRTCADPSHQQLEQAHTERGQAQFQLRERLRRANLAISELSNAIPEFAGSLRDDDGKETLDVGPSTLASRGPGHTGTDIAGIGPRRLRAQFARKRTHNEQIIVAPCGIILARATFYGAEAVSSVAEFIKRTFRIYGHTPNHVIFDNNCSLAKHIQSTGDTYFQKIGLAVDVFHFKSKHSESDVFCQQNCNPYAFPELRGDGEKGWYFNTSIAEQTNVWLGKYGAACRKMRPARYNFFLDEMILQRNKLTRERLIDEGFTPCWFPVGRDAAEVGEAHT